MDKFCGSKFWNWNLTWYTNSPQFTSCFEETVLVWLPCSYLFVFSIFAFYFSCKSKVKDIPWSWLNVSKLIGIGILLFITFLDINYAFFWHPHYLKMHGVDYVSGIIKHLTFLLASILVVNNKKKGIRTSGIMFWFWFLLVICALPHYITEINSITNKENTIRVYPYISNVIYFPIILSMLILELFIDSSPRLSQHHPVKHLSPETKVSFVNNLLSLWYDIVAIHAFRQPLQLKDLWDLEYENKLDYLVPLFNKHWNAVISETSKKRKWLKCKNTAPNKYRKILEKSRQISIIPILWKCFSATYISGVLCKILADCLIFVSPLLLSLFINFEQSNEPVWRGYLYMSGLVINGIIQTILLNIYVSSMYKLGLQTRSVLMAIIFRKSLTISNNARKMFSYGDIINLMSVDAQRFYDLNLAFNMTVASPFIIFAALFFLWKLMGLSALAGVVVIIMLIPINAILVGKTKSWQTQQMKYKDERVKITNEVLIGMKVIKMYAWESSFGKKILEIRKQEIKLLKKISYINTSISFVWTTAPFLLSLATFAVFTISSDKNVLNAEIALIALSLFNIIKLPLSMLPRISNIVQAVVASKRISRFLNCDDLDMLAVMHNQLEKDPLLIENGEFTWDKEIEQVVLKNINLRISTGSLVAVVGPVGCGKSSIISAFLGEMNKLRGRVNTKGSIAYLPQQAWLQNASLRDNVLFTSPYNQKLYDKVIYACALLPDIRVLPAGDLTEIGEKGINLSGGQKQRINLARAVYNNADIYLLDDPLSAVDSHVGKHIFENVIGPKGLLRKKTRLLVTHSVTYLPEVDAIIVMKNGTITEYGTYSELMARQGDFSEFIANYSQNERKETEKDRPNIKGLDLSEDTVLSSTPSIIPSSDDINDNLSPSTAAGERLTEDELVKTGNINFSIYLHYLKSGGVLLWIFTLLFNVLYQTTATCANFWLTYWSTDSDILSNGIKGASKKYFYLGIYALYGIGQVITIIIATLSMYLATTNASMSLHRKLLNKILKWPAYLFDVTPVGRIINRFSFDVDVIDNTIPFTIRQFFVLGGTMLSTLFVISCSSPIFILAIIPIMGLYIFLEQVYVTVQRQLKRLESISRTPIYSLFSETVSGASLIRASDMQNKFIVEADQKIYANQVFTYPSILAQKWVCFRLDNIGNSIILFSALFAVLERGTINAGILSLSVTYALQISGTLNWFIRTASDLETNIVAAERIKEFEETPEEVDKLPINENISNKWPNEGEIIFDNFHTRYREGLDLVLRGLNLKINSGEKVGIAGRTGSGKSSLTLSLFRIIEAADGRIIIDGFDISTVKLQTLRSRITIIPQDPVLFSGNIRLNLDPFFEYSDRDLWRVLDLAHLKNFVKSLPMTLNHVISESGENLSIGQRQLICLARALLRKTKILILDEATAAIDLETDELIQKTIRKEFKQCTVLTIAHKLNTIMDSDRILVLDNGQVKEFDTPKNLLVSKKTIFYNMAKDAGLVS